jgi:hypothetical protein
LEVRNYPSASELASLSIQQADREMSEGRQARMWTERSQLGLPLAASILLLVFLLWRSRGVDTAWTVAAAVLATGLYHVLFLRAGNVYSFSHIPVEGLAATLEPSLRRAAAALGAGSLLIVGRTWQQKNRSAFNVAMRGYGYAALQAYLIALLVGVCAWWNGLRFRWYLPDFTIAYLHFAALMQLMLTALLAIPLPIGIAVLQRVLLAITDGYTAANQRAKRLARSS